MNVKKKFFLGVFLVCVALGLSSFVYKGMTDSWHRETESISAESKEESSYITYGGNQYKYNSNLKCILFMGIDQKGDVQLVNTDGHGGQADSINLLVYDKAAESFRIMQISRDSMVNVEVLNNYGEVYTTINAQLCTQYAYGDGKSGSCRLMEERISELLYQIPISGYVALDITGIGAINEAVGGITLTIPEDYTDIDPAFVKGTTITLTDQQAELYVRKRDTSVTGSNDSRMERQLQFMQQFLVQAKAYTSSDSAFIDTALQLLDDYIVTDLTADQMKEYFSYDHDSSEDCKVLGQTKQGEVYDEYHIDEDALYQMILDVFYVQR